MRATFIAGNYTDCGGEPFGDQEVIREIAFKTSVLGAFHPWPLCYNYRGWPNQRHCLTGNGPILSHQDKSLWPSHIRAANGTRILTANILAFIRWEN